MTVGVDVKLWYQTSSKLHFAVKVNITDDSSATKLASVVSRNLLVIISDIQIFILTNYAPHEHITNLKTYNLHHRTTKHCLLSRYHRTVSGRFHTVHLSPSPLLSHLYILSCYTL